jgi:hypothetical protein
MSLLWFIYFLHLGGALPERLDDIVFVCGYLLGGRVVRDEVGIDSFSFDRSNAFLHAIILAPLAMGLPFVFIVQAIRRLEAEKMQLLWKVRAARPIAVAPLH